MIQQIITIGRNTFLESIRQPIFMILIMAAGLLLVMNLSVAQYTMDDDNKQLLDMGLSTLFVTGVLLAAFTATGVLSQEVENKTVLTVVSKPVSRPVFVLGKYVGVAAALGVAYWVLTVIFLLTIRHKVMQTASDPFDLPVISFGLLALLLALVISAVGNYLYHWVFSSSVVVCQGILFTIAFVLVLFISKEWAFQSPMVEFQDQMTPQLFKGLLVLFQGLLIICAVAITTSTRLGQVMTLLICLGFLMLGLASDPLLAELSTHALWAKTLYRMIPNLHMFWLADHLTQGYPISDQYIMYVSAYCGLVVAGFLSLGVVLFQTREVG